MGGREGGGGLVTLEFSGVLRAAAEGGVRGPAVLFIHGSPSGLISTPGGGERSSARSDLRTTAAGMEKKKDPSRLSGCFQPSVCRKRKKNKLELH